MDPEGQIAQAKIVKRLQALKPSTGRGKPNVSHATAAKRTEARGLKNLSKADTQAPRQSHTVVMRYFYESRGGELLAFDTAPMSPTMADKETLSRPPNDWKNIVKIAANSPHRSAQEQGYRLVTLPSQMKDAPTC